MEVVALAWHNVLITQPARLSVKKAQLHCQQEGESLTIPLEDIASITLECLQTTLTGSLLSKLATNNTVMLTCDEQHHPNGVLLPIAQHSRQLSVLRLQMNATQPFKKRLWQIVVRKKISNQASVLRWQQKSGVNRLERLAKGVSSGDINNCEAIAAKIYFSSLFTDFKRHDEDFTNRALNYGYSIIRAAIARELTAFGLHPSLGIHHASELNSFNLADDLLEPFRGILDSWVIAALDLDLRNMQGATDVDQLSTLSKDERVALTQVLQLQVGIQSETHTLQNAVRLCVKSLVSALKNKEIQMLLLPVPLFPPTLKLIN
mgnify:CR=1 FL=1